MGGTKCTSHASRAETMIAIVFSIVAAFALLVYSHLPCYTNKVMLPLTLK